MHEKDLPYISPVSPLHLPYISPTSPLHLPHISQVGSLCTSVLNDLVRLALRPQLRWANPNPTLALTLNPNPNASRSGRSYGRLTLTLP